MTGKREEEPVQEEERIDVGQTIGIQGLGKKISGDNVCTRTGGQKSKKKRETS